MVKFSILGKVLSNRAMELNAQGKDADTENFSIWRNGRKESEFYVNIDLDERRAGRKTRGANFGFNLFKVRYGKTVYSVSFNIACKAISMRVQVNEDMVKITTISPWSSFPKYPDFEKAFRAYIVALWYGRVRA
jgi:hypothetical protein